MKRLFTLLLGLLLFAAGLLTGCSENGGDFQQGSYSADGTQVKEIIIDVRDREIAVSLSNDDQIYIDYFESDKESFNISLSEDNVLMMTAETDKNWRDYIGGKAAPDKRKIQLRVPNALLSSLALTTTNEDILLAAMNAADSLSLSVNGGNITFEELHVGTALNLKAKNGNISGTIAGNCDDFSISCEIKKGESNLPSGKDNGRKSLTASNNNGNIEIDFTGE